MDCTLNLSNLYKLLYNTFLITEEVKEVLRNDCDEAAFVLKPWQVKTIVEKQTDENICNCKKNESEAKEIAAGISKAIILAQELREKLKLNVASKKKPLRKDTVENIYLSKSASISDHKKISSSNITTQKANIVKNSDKSCKGSSAHQNDKATSVVMRKSVGNIKRNNAIDKMQSLAKVAEKSKKEKNFILKNKLNIKKISTANKIQVDDSNSNDIPQNSRKSVMPEASAAELSDLIHKMVKQSTKSALTSVENDCTLHGKDVRQSIQESIIMIDVIEALRHFNVPNEIVKVLRIYHAFLKTEMDNLNDSKEDRYKKSVDTFLTELEAMNTTTRDYLSEEPCLFNKTTKSITAFSNILSEDLNSTQLNTTKTTSTELEASLKQYDKNIESIAEVSSRNLSLTSGWMSNGIWNISCMEHFTNFTKAYNIRYSNKKQLLSLYEIIQKLQRINYLNTLIQIILRDVIPTVKSNIEPASAEYAQAYKTMFILYQGLNPKVPVLVRTDI
ncbi:hypothetical protein P5V15_005259 [Pogonomyrmex californicus]